MAKKNPEQLDVIRDARRMRAIAHPVRIQLLEALHREGPLTATRAAELLNDSPGNMSWHLQTLAKYGYVEEAGGGRGRSRPWKRAAEHLAFETGIGDPETAAAGDALEASFLERYTQHLHEWWAQRRSYPIKWRRASFSTDRLLYLTAPEMARLGDDIRDLTAKFAARSQDRSQRPAGALPVNLVAWAHPLPPTPSGN